MSAKDIFGRFDTNDDNVIDAHELRDGLLALNLAALPPSEVDRLVETIDENGDGSVDLGELEAILSDASMQYSESVLERVMNKHGIDDADAFVQYARSFDENENRYLDQKELTKAAEAFVSQPEPGVVVERWRLAPSERPACLTARTLTDHLAHHGLACGCHCPSPPPPLRINM